MRGKPPSHHPATSLLCSRQAQGRCGLGGAGEVFGLDIGTRLWPKECSAYRGPDHASLTPRVPDSRKSKRFIGAFRSFARVTSNPEAEATLQRQRGLVLTPQWQPNRLASVLSKSLATTHYLSALGTAVEALGTILRGPVDAGLLPDDQPRTGRFITVVLCRVRLLGVRLGFTGTPKIVSEGTSARRARPRYPHVSATPIPAVWQQQPESEEPPPERVTARWRWNDQAESQQSARS